jgi:acetyl-CoA C-acetyltransferase
MSGLGGKVAIIGTGTIKFGENFHQSLTDMIYEAVTLAMADAKIEPRQLEAGWLGCYEPMLYGFEGNSGTFVSDPLNLFPIPVTRVAAYCATGIEAVRNAALAVASGEYDLVLAVGAEQDARGALARLARRAGREPWASRAGQGPDCPRHVRASRHALLQGVRGG